MNKVRRVTALLTVVLIVVLVIATLVCALTGSQHFFGMLALTFLIPIVLWVFMWFAGLAADKSGKSLENDECNDMDESF